jgi:hypothetical protein
MRQNKVITAVDPASAEQRRLARKKVLLEGVIADPESETGIDCVIRDIHAEGAAVSPAKRLRMGARVFLLDTGNAIAHECRVAWSGADKAGLSFVRNYAMGLGLPPKLKFLYRLLFEGRLRQAERAIAMGVPNELALSTSSLTKEHMRQMERHAASDERLQRLLERASRLLGG